MTQSPPTIRRIADTSKECLGLTLNFVIADITGASPLMVTSRLNTRQYSDSRGERDTVFSCFNRLVDAYGYIPMRYSYVRADPVLFKDDVSILRKEFKQLESSKTYT